MDAIPSQRPSPASGTLTSRALLAQASRGRMTWPGCRHPPRIYVFTRILGRCKPIYTQGDSDVISMPVGFRRHLVGKTLFSLWYRWNTLCWQASNHTDIFINQRIECYINNTTNLNSMYYAMLYPQNGDRIVAIDSVTSLHPVYICQSGPTNFQAALQM